ncbi:MAG: ribonuclease HI [Planctomycetes bacterium]|nr:ribonuclease HI [Planctomycetota bacterium]
MKKVTIYTDGACSGNPGIGGFGAILRFGRIEKKIQGAHSNTTNNQMEMLAVIRALENLTEPCEVSIYTDSKYVKNGMTEWIQNWLVNNWRNSAKKPVKNKALWQRMLAAVEKHKISWHWVRGHAGDEYNEKADALATGAIDRLRKGEISEENFEV